MKTTIKVILLTSAVWICILFFAMMPFIFPQAKDPRYDIISYHESSHAKWIHVPEDVRILRFSQQHLSWGQLKGCFPTSWLNS